MSRDIVCMFFYLRFPKCANLIVFTFPDNPSADLSIQLIPPLMTHPPYIAIAFIYWCILLLLAPTGALYVIVPYYTHVPRSISKYPEVPQHTQKYPELLQITQKHLKVPRSSNRNRSRCWLYWDATRQEKKRKQLATVTVLCLGGVDPRDKSSRGGRGPSAWGRRRPSAWGGRRPQCLRRWTRVQDVTQLGDVSSCYGDLYLCFWDTRPS